MEQKRLEELKIAVNDITSKNYVKKSTIKCVQNGFKIVESVANKEEKECMNKLCGLIEKAQLSSNDKKEIKKIQMLIMTAINRYVEEYNDEPNEDEITDDDVDSIEKKLDSKIHKYNKYSENNPMKWIS